MLGLAGIRILADALDQVRALEGRLQAALDRLDGEAAAPVSDRHVGAGHQGLPPAAAPAGPVKAAAIAATVPRAAAADQQLGIEEGATTEGPAAMKFTWDWD